MLVKQVSLIKFRRHSKENKTQQIIQIINNLGPKFMRLVIEKMFDLKIRFTLRPECTTKPSSNVRFKL